MNTISRADRGKSTLTVIVAAALLTAGLLTACSKDDSCEAPAAKLVVNGTEINVPYVATINGKKVSLDEYRYYFLNAKYQMDNGDDAYWDGEDGDSLQRRLKADALYSLKQTYAVESMAESLKLTLTDDERSQIESDVKNQISTLGGTSQYTKALGANYLTDGLYRSLWEVNFYCEKLWTYYFSENGEFHISDGALSEDEEEQQYSIKFQALLAEAVDSLTVELAPEYDLISVESLT